jgi:uncharacterized protein (TIGR03000 family)
MKYTRIRIASFVVGSLMVLSSGTVNAGWGLLGGAGGSSGGGSSGYLPAAYAGSTGGSSGYSAAYASYGSVGGGSLGGASSGGASVGGSSGGPGLLQRAHSRIHGHLAAKRARHAARRAAYGSSGGSSGYVAYSASYGSSGSFGSSGGSVYSGGSSGGAVSYGSTGVSYGSVGGGYGSVGATYYGASTTAGRSAASLVSNVDALSDAIYLTVNVPGNAKVFVNGNPTTSTGAVRQYVSRGLEPGKSYKFEIRAEVEGVDGKVLTEEKTVAIAAGEREQLQFAFADSDSKIETAVTLNLPEGAQVILAGKTTKATGTQRTFRTSHLKPGQVWDDYEIEVKLGEQVKRQTVRLIAGDSLQLSFNFDEASEGQLASR